MLDCKQASQIISQSLDRPLTMRERFALKLHLLICKYCKQFSQQLHTLRVTIKQMTASVEDNHQIELPNAAKKRITDMVVANSQQP
jgi:hypothetical protein